MSNPNAELILDYASIYLSESDNDNPQFMSKTIGEIENEIANDENKITLMPTPRSSIGAVPAYRDNINAATAYARLWAEDYNPAYKRQSNGDCCNFVSQILTAGKLYGTLPSYDLPKNINSDTKYWYYINSNQMSSSFIYVPDFYKFYSSRVESAEFQKQESVINAAKEGDVVLLKRASSGARYHAIYI